MNQVIKASNNKVEPYWPGLFAKALEGQDIGDLLSNVGSAPAGGAAAAGGAPAAGGAEAVKEEKKEEGKKPYHLDSNLLSLYDNNFDAFVSI